LASGATSPLPAAPSSADPRDDEGNATGDGSAIQGIIRAAASDDDANIISAPHILTSDNEEAEIRVGDNIPIITSRVQSAQGITTPTPTGDLATSVNVERQDIRDAAVTRSHRGNTLPRYLRESPRSAPLTVATRGLGAVGRGALEPARQRS
jgi:hypothetical protein